jgi:hypothetical protein
MASPHTCRRFGADVLLGEKQMASMTDPTDSLASFQEALLASEIRLQRGKLDPDIFVYMDNPKPDVNQ